MNNSGDRAIRIGAVAYLNSKPLIEQLLELAPDASLQLDHPSRLADELRDGRLDVALIPLVECFREPDYEIVSDACVATTGPVLSVKMYSRVPPEDIRTLALDAGSRTSAALVQILLSERCGIRPTLHSLPLDARVSDVQTDAVLVIGDRAMRPFDDAFRVTWDLGEVWTDWTGLPFVFAVWAARTTTQLGTIEAALSESRDRGCADLNGIARRESIMLGLPEPYVLEYLRDNLHYRLGPAEQDGIRRFRSLATDLNLIPEGADLVFRNCTTA